MKSNSINSGVLGKTALTYIIPALLLVAIAWNVQRCLFLAKDAYLLDFHLVYVAGVAYAHGENAYSNNALQSVWNRIPAQEKGEFTRPLQPYPFMYPPAMLAAVQPLAAIPWRYVVPLVYALQILLYGALVVLLIRLGNMMHRRYEIVLLFLCTLAFKPVLLALLIGQPLLLSLTAGIASLYYAQQQKHSSAILFLTLSCLKPTIGLCFFAYYIVQRNWRTLLSVSFLLLAVNLVAWGFMPDGSFGTYLSEVSASFQRGGINDSSRQGLMYNDLSSVGGMVSVISDSQIIGTITNVALGFFLLWLLFRLRRVFILQPYHAVVLTMFASLFLVYHRSNDTAILLFIFALYPPSLLQKGLGWHSLWFLFLFFPLTKALTLWVGQPVVDSYFHSSLYYLVSFVFQIALFILFTLYVRYVLRLSNRLSRKQV